MAGKQELLPKERQCPPTIKHATTKWAVTLRTWRGVKIGSTIVWRTETQCDCLQSPRRMSRSCGARYQPLSISLFTMILPLLASKNREIEVTMTIPHVTSKGRKLRIEKGGDAHLTSLAFRWTMASLRPSTQQQNELQQKREPSNRLVAWTETKTNDCEHVSFDSQGCRGDTLSITDCSILHPAVENWEATTTSVTENQQPVLRATNLLYHNELLKPTPSLLQMQASANLDWGEAVARQLGHQLPSPWLIRNSLSRKSGGFARLGRQTAE